jgi:O-antigen/teichoic acid export membrane protein
LLASLLATGATYLLYEGPVDQPHLFLPAVVGIAAYLLLTNPAWNLDSVFVAFGDGRRLFWVRANQSAAFLMFVVALSFVLPTVWGPILATIGSWVVSLIHRLGAVRAWMRFRAPLADVRAGFTELPEIIRFGLKLTPGSIASGIGGQSTIWVLGSVTTVATVGAYSRASTISRRFAEVNWRMREMLFPSLVRRRADADREAFDRALIDSIRYSMVALMLPAATLGGASVSVMALFGSSFEFAAPALAISMVGPALLGTNGMRVAATIAIEKPVSVTLARLGGLLAKLVAIVPLTLAWGITGAAAATLIGPFSTSVWLNVVLRRHLGLRPTQLFPLRQLASVAAAYAAGFLAATVLQDVLVQPLGLAVALLGGGLAYAATYVAVGGPTERDRSRFQILLRRLRMRARRREHVAPAA